MARLQKSEEEMRREVDETVAEAYDESNRRVEEMKEREQTLLEDKENGFAQREKAQQASYEAEHEEGLSTAKQEHEEEMRRVTLEYDAKMTGR